MAVYWCSRLDLRVGMVLLVMDPWRLTLPGVAVGINCNQVLTCRWPHPPPPVPCLVSQSQTLTQESGDTCVLLIGPGIYGTDNWPNWHYHYVPLICFLPQFFQTGPVQSVQLLHKVGYLFSNAWYTIHQLLQETFAGLVLQASLKVGVRGYNKPISELLLIVYMYKNNTIWHLFHCC